MKHTDTQTHTQTHTYTRRCCCETNTHSRSRTCLGNATSSQQLMDVAKSKEERNTKKKMNTRGEEDHRFGCTTARKEEKTRRESSSE